MAELKPCPFCGNEFPMLDNSQGYGWQIKCPSCEITFSRDSYAFRGELGKTRLFEAWNRRAT